VGRSVCGLAWPGGRPAASPSRWDLTVAKIEKFFIENETHKILYNIF
jgi:hypothetical protein